MSFTFWGTSLFSVGWKCFHGEIQFKLTQNWSLRFLRAENWNFVIEIFLSSSNNYSTFKVTFIHDSIVTTLSVSMKSYFQMSCSSTQNLSLIFIFRSWHFKNSDWYFFHLNCPKSSNIFLKIKLWLKTFSFHINFSYFTFMNISIHIIFIIIYNSLDKLPWALFNVLEKWKCYNVMKIARIMRNDSWA